MAEASVEADEVDGLVEEIQRHLKLYPEIQDWPALCSLIDRETASGRPCWQFVLDACEAIGGDRGDARGGAAAVFCLLYSIHLVDDMLDDDPKGIYHDVGPGAASNMALAFQSLASRVLGESGLGHEREAAAHRRLAEAALGTAYGQMLDASDIEGEEAYWRMVSLKTPPLFSFALFLGALYGGAGAERAAQIAELGGVLGEIVQINDDLHDALEKPAAPDWQRRATNLPILFASTADHPEKERFLELVPRVEELGCLEEAQEILVRCGAFSFCAYRLITAYRRARTEIQELALPRPEAMVDLFDFHVAPLKGLFRKVGVETPEDLFEGADA